jgi:hypothetical protein
LREPIPKRERQAFAAPRLRASRRPGRIVPPAGKARLSRWLVLGGLLSVMVTLAAGLWFQLGIWPPALLSQKKSSASQADRHQFEHKDAARTPYLAFGNSKASINQPLPLGIVLHNSVGEETVLLSGFVEGTSLSAGAALSAARWSVPGRELDKAFISAPENFDGVMHVTVTLYSSRQDILETKEARFEWSGSGKGDKLPVTTPLARHPAR